MGGCLVLGVGSLVWLVVGKGGYGGVCCNNAVRKPTFQALPYREGSVAAALAFCLCFLSQFTEKSFKLKVIKNFAVFDYF